MRLTGGEPLLRNEIERLVAQLTAIPGLEELGLTTNGTHLAEKGAALMRAGLRRVNISLDTLNPLRFQWICLADALHQVWDGIHTALRLGFRIKLNTVVVRGITAEDVSALVQLAVTHDCDVRFIEFMPLCGSGWDTDLHVPIATVREWIDARWALHALPQGTAPAQTFRVGDGPGRVGFIASLTHPFCARCARIRLTADGQIRPCLFAHEAIDLRPALHSADDAQLSAAIRDAVAAKPAGHAGHHVAAWKGTAQPLIQQVGG